MRGKRVSSRDSGRVTTVALVAALITAGGWLGQATEPTNAVVPGNNGLIAFHSDRDGDYEIYTITPKGEVGKKGKPARQLTHNRFGDLFPAWSPDASRIAFESDRDGNFEIYVMAATGSAQTRLTNNSGDDHFPTWSPNGFRITFSASSASGDRLHIYTMAIDGTDRRRLTRGSTINEDPDWQVKP